MIDLPDVNFQAKLSRSGNALGDLVAIFVIRFTAWQHVAGVMGASRPQHVGDDHIESCCGKFLGRPVPVARIGARAGMVPERSAFDLPTGDGSNIGIRQQFLGVGRRLDRSGIVFTGKLLRSGVLGLHCGVQTLDGRPVSGRLHESSYSVNVAQVADLADPVQVGARHFRPERWVQLTKNGCQHLLLGGSIVSEHDVTEIGAVVVDQHGRIAGRLALAVVPPANDACLRAARFNDIDIPRGLTHGEWQSREIGGIEPDLGQCARLLGMQILHSSDPQQPSQARGQGVAGKQLAALLHELLDG